MADVYPCPECGKALKNTPDTDTGVDADGNAWPAMGCLEHGLFGRRQDGSIVPVEPVERFD